ncbi:eggshell protein isoform X1 [Culex quinquefasciatus]|uniref:eggshell protein isoform X1 n=1 Tax=Culex quinquefasciatus TaxID=7176 RepID=UPI0018E3E32B|nr:eggshell protein isoform X1 [Culex quinquefasciatus]
MYENYKCPLCGERFESEEIIKNHLKSCFDSSSNLNQTSNDPAANGVITSQPIAANATSFAQQSVPSRNAPDEYVGCCYGCCSDEDGDAYTSDHQRGITSTTSSSDHAEPLGGGGGWFSSSGDNGGAIDNDCNWGSGGGGGGGDSGGGGCGGDSGGGDCSGGGSSSCD